MKNVRLSIIIPAHNEELRIGATLDAYAEFFLDKQQLEGLDFELLVVLNGCKDNTQAVVQAAQQEWGNCIRMIVIEQAGKGLAITAGFNDALQRVNSLIGFVDADMATKPAYFYALIPPIMQEYDGAIASRYMPGAQVFPERPRYKRWGSILFYESLARVLFGIRFYDYQCGAKLFTRAVVAKILPHLQVKQWAFDVELLYLCRKYSCKIAEIPTVWRDQAGSKLNVLSGGMRMLASLIKLRLAHSPFKWLVTK